MQVLRGENISVSFEGKSVIEDISLELRQGEIISLLGVSGSGKTTLFNVLSGITSPDSGRVLLQGEEVTGRPGKIGYMLQKDMLLRHYTLLDNVSLPLILSGMKKKQAREKALSYFGLFGLQGAERKYPAELSGGMRQRGALLRTYLTGARVVLLDEPFSALDSVTKASLHRWYLEMLDKLQLSTVFVTHDIEEALLLSDRIYILSGSPGRITDEILPVLSQPRGRRDADSEELLRYKKEIRSKLI